MNLNIHIIYDDKFYELEFFDTSAVPSNLLCEIMVLGYSITSITTLNYVKSYKKKHTAVSPYPNILLGCGDERNSEKRVPTADVSTLAAVWGCPFLEITNNSSNTIKEAIKAIITETLRQRMLAANTREMRIVTRGRVNTD